MTMRAALTDLLEIEHPILLAPMGNVAGGALAAAVSAAGGLGLTGGGYAGPAVAVVFAGEDVDLIHDLAPAGVLVRRVVAEAEAALAAAPGRAT